MCNAHCAYVQAENWLHKCFSTSLINPAHYHVDGLKAMQAMQGIGRFIWFAGFSLKFNSQLFTEYQIPKGFEQIPPKREQQYADMQGIDSDFGDAFYLGNIYLSSHKGHSFGERQQFFKLIKSFEI